MVPRVKGTQDFLDLTLFNFITSKLKTHCERYNFNQIATPILEPLELFKRSLGLETDVVSKEMYVVGTGHEEEESLCLRPEATASIMRAFFNNNIETRPWKVFAYGPMFRHERPQKGRYRQFHQITVEMLDAPSIMYDVELITLLDRFFTNELKLNSYALLINFLGCQQDRSAFKEKLYAFLTQHHDKICATCSERKEKNILRVFDCKNPQCQELYQQAPHITDHLCSKCQTEWTSIQEKLHELSVSYSIMPTLVRGLDYYNKTVFEFVSRDLGAQSTFCGGGRYDGLSVALGEKEEVPSVGAGIGIERLMLMLEAHKEKLFLPQQKTLHVIVPFTKEQQTLALLLADTLRFHDLVCDVMLDEASLKSMMRRASKMGARWCLLIGSDEVANNYVTIKNMTTGEESKVPQSEILSFIKR